MRRIAAVSMASRRDIVERHRLEIALQALEEVASFRFDPSKPVADRVRIKAKAQKALDDIRKLESNGTAST